MWTIPNLLSLTRIILVIPICWLLYEDKMLFAIIIGIIAMITDAFDGYFARKFNDITELGKILDPLADKIMLGGIAIVLISKGLLPLWFVIIIIIRDILIVTGGKILADRLQQILPSNLTGKITFAALGTTVLGIMFKVPYFDPWAIYFSTVMIVFSLISYTRRFITVLRANN